MMKPLLTTFFAVIPLLGFADESEFTCVLKTEHDTISKGQIPKVSITITNNSEKEQVLVGSLDGSDVGWRYPKCGFELFDSEGKILPKGTLGRCGNMNMLRVNDFVCVAAGKEFDPLGKGFFGAYQRHQFKELHPGTYYVRFYYKTTAKKVQEYFGDERRMGKKEVSPEIQELFEQVPKLDLRSNKLKIVITEKADPTAGLEPKSEDK